jgi:hypothetical protein
MTNQGIRRHGELDLADQGEDRETSDEIAGKLGHIFDAE